MAALARNIVLGQQKRMPRVSTSAKRQQAVTNHRDQRHENGLVNPARRVAKQKSQSQLDGSLKPAVDHAAAPPVPAASSPTTNGFFKNQNDDMAPDRRATEMPRHYSLSSPADASSTDFLANPYGAASNPEEKHRQINVNDAKNANVHKDSGPLDFAITVLRSCPLHDTIAILIILMQVSPVALASIYMLFTLLTFVPPVTTSSGISITEIFDGIQGTPSLWTLVGMDVVMLLIWLFLFAPAQQFILDLAQVVIALTLGGGGSSRTGAANNIFICVAIVGLSQWTRASKWNNLSRLTSLLGPNRFFPPESDDPLESTLRAFEKRGTYGWVRSILAIHILTQGLVRWIREWYLRREKKDLLSQSQQDPEAAKSANYSGEGGAENGLPAAGTDSSVGHTSSTVSTKKRRKQSAQVRVRQPLWAALASTKIVMVKEYELSHAASESAGSNATDIHNLGNAPFNTQPEQIWICYIGSDEVCFNTSYFPEDDSEPYAGLPAGIDATKPFYVRVNNAVWQPTRITPIEDGSENARQGTCWTGDIYGLTPFSTYDCQFVSTRTGEIIFATSARTIQAKSRDLDPTAKAASNQRSRIRHDSPASTLRASIAAAEEKLADEKARLKAARKDNKTKINAAKKDIDKVTSAAQSAGGNDEKLRQKIAQNSIQQKQTEQSILELEKELKELATIPEEVVEQYRAKQTEWTAEKAEFDGARASFKSFKSSVDRELKGFEEEQASLQSKRSKIAMRIAKVDNEHARITDANARGLDEAERRRQGQAALEADIARHEQQLADRINTLHAINASKHSQIHEMAGYLSAYLSSFQEEETLEQASPPGQYATVPWGPPAGQYNPAQPPWWPPVSSMQPPVSNLGPAMVSPFVPSGNPIMGTPPQHKTRGRSSSMLSDVSGFTQSTDEEEQGTVTGSQGHHRFGNGQLSNHGTPTSTLRGPSGFVYSRNRQRSDVGSNSGSGSGTGSGSPLGSGRSSVRSGSGSGGSLRDPTSPI